MFVVGCQTITPCSYDLHADGWTKTELRPKEVLKTENSKSFWYVNKQNELLVCPKLDRADICGSVYTKGQEGYTLTHEILCIG